MSKYVERVLADLKAKNPNEPEFHQAATEILECLAPVIEKKSTIRKSRTFRKIRRTWKSYYV